MREIKFRAWDVKGKRIIYHGAFVFEQLTFPVSVRPDEVRQLIFPMEGIESGELVTGNPLDCWNLMQYTGLKDNNGVEIYEGDVISARSNGANFPINYIVVFNEKDLGFRLRAGCRYKDNNPGFYDEKISPNQYNIFQVIGNIHENPELIK